MMLFSYLRYLAKRKNEFSIHSPFVYKLYTEVIKHQHDDVLQVLGIQRVEEFGVGSFVDDLDASTMYVLKNIHGSRNNEAIWNTICRRPDVTLSIDLYRKGLLFCREGMEKQHFVLKYRKRKQ